MEATMRPPASTDRREGLPRRAWDALLAGSVRPLDHETARLRRSYAVQLWATEVPVSLHTAILVIGVINLGFIAADWWTFSEQFWFCLPARLCLTAALMLFWNPRGPSERLLAGLLLYLTTGLMIIWVIVAAGGTASEYAPGLVLLLAGIPILLPVSALQALVVVGLLLAIYTAIPLVDADPLSARLLVLHLSFPWAAGFGALIACHRLDSVRFADYCKRHALEEAGEKLRSLDEAKTRFIANINHELRTPLTLLLLPTDELLAGRAGALTDSQREYLEVVRGNASRLLYLVNNVLTAAAVARKGVDLRPRMVDLASVVAETLADASSVTQRKSLEQRTNGLEAVGTIVADPDALKRALVNIVENAVKFTPVGGWIEVETKREGPGVQISVRDSGIGFRKEDATRIFERFVQLDDGPTRRHGGIGIGLAITRDLVELHGGRIWAESEGIGKGAAIHVWLPEAMENRVEDCGGGARRLVERRPNDLLLEGIDCGGAWDEVEGESYVAPLRSLPNVAIGKHDVLVVDDSHGMRLLLERLLSNDFRVRTAASGREALCRIRESLPDLIVADVMMEDLGGTELCKVVKGDSATCGIPIILVTALSDEESKITGLELGAEDYIGKPFLPRELLAKAHALLRLRSAQCELSERNRALQEAIQALDASNRRSELYARAVSHDLRSPIAAAVEAVNAALRGAPWPVERALEIAAENLSRADRMLVALRSFTRTVSAPAEHEERRLRDLLEDVVRGAEAARGGVGPPIVKEIEDESVVAGAERLSHVFRNLLDNALRAVDDNPTGKVVVRTSQDGTEAVVEIADNGCGIHRELQDAIFEPFRRGPCSKAGNLGLGLALARQITEEHGGRIEIQSQLGNGSTFTVRLPAWREPRSNG